MNKMTPDPAYRLLSSLSNKLILFGSHYGSPCMNIAADLNKLVETTDGWLTKIDGLLKRKPDELYHVFDNKSLEKLYFHLFVLLFLYLFL
jgi:hypothetical protein